MTDDKKTKRKVSHGDVARYAWHYFKRRPKSGLGALALMMAAVAADSMVPIYTGRIVDALVNGRAGDEQALQTAFAAFAMFLVLAVSYNVLRATAVYIWNWFAARNLYDIVTESLQKVQRFSTDWHANAFAGGTVRKITRAMWSFDVFEDTFFFGLIPAMLVMICITGVLFATLPLVGWFVLTMALLYCGASIWMAIAVLAPRFQTSAEADTKVGAALADIMTSIATVKSFGTETREDGLFHDVATNWKAKAYRAWQTAQTADLVRAMLRLSMMAGMMGLTVWLWWRGQASPGDLAMVITCFFLIGGYLRDVGQHISNLQKAVSEMEDAVLFWLREDEVSDAPDARPFVPGPVGKRGAISFDGVRFSYQGQTKAIYEDFTLRIAPGEKIALVGHSGSGKSTMVKLVQRLYDVQSGTIKIDGQNIAHVTQDSLRRAIALVPQEPVLFHRTLAANIAYGRPGASREEIMEAARKAYAHEFISALPHGYETLVGERGVKLSGGERQRVAIARAMLADAPILILDEATSSLDSLSEHYIQMALEHLTAGRTTITIAHRLATIRKAERILVFDKGRIVEEGRHEKLIQNPQSLYRALHEMQAMGLADPVNELVEAAE
ncbi:MAG: ABC transporter ATP-binding protein/permease [Alphaproteobacteria bacterium]|nr:ABC transporter ATP-binding protein/permease [Alphaproteobacteria bacterium]